jgi:serine/threonine protein kinase
VRLWIGEYVIAVVLLDGVWARGWLGCTVKAAQLLRATATPLLLLRHSALSCASLPDSACLPASACCLCSQADSWEGRPGPCFKSLVGTPGYMAPEIMASFFTGV